MNTDFLRYFMAGVLPLLFYQPLHVGKNMDILDLYLMEVCGRSIRHAALLNWYNMKQELERFQKYWEYSCFSL